MRKLLAVVVVAFVFGGCGCGEDPIKTAIGELDVPENSLDFGQACPRPTSDELKVEQVTRTVHLKNNGIGALNINKFEVEAGKQDQFVFDTTRITPGTTVIESGEELPIDITFVPTSPGTTIADLTIDDDNDDVVPFVVKLIGEGKSAPPNPGVIVSCLGGKFDSNPDSPNDTCSERDPVSNQEKLRDNINFFFRDAPLGEVALASFKVRNTGCPTLEVSNIAVTTDTANGADPATYALDAGQKDSLAVVNGAEGEIKVAFNPKLADVFEGTLTFTTNDPAMKTVSIPLKGLGIEPQIVALPQTCDFRTPGACNGKFTLRNSGEQELTLGEITLEKGSNNFTLTGKPAAGTTLAANGGELVDAILITYTPDIAADVTDYLVINSSGGQARVLLRGGSFPVLVTEPDFEVNFGQNLDPSKAHYQKLTVRNFATWAKQLPLTIKAVTPTPAKSAFFDLKANPGDASCPAPPTPNTEIPVGQEKVLCFEFKPPVTGGSFSVDYVIDTDDPLWSTVPYTITVVGSTSCNPKPSAEITAPTTTACGTGNPCSGQSKCIGGFCHATGSYTHSISADGNEIELSCAASYDLTGPVCDQQDPAGVTECAWNLRTKPAGSTATITPNGQTTQKFTKLKVDKVGPYQLLLRAYDATNQSSEPTTFTINVTP